MQVLAPRDRYKLARRTMRMQAHRGEEGGTRGRGVVERFRDVNVGCGHVNMIHILYFCDALLRSLHENVFGGPEKVGWRRIWQRGFGCRTRSCGVGVRLANVWSRPHDADHIGRGLL